MPSKSNIRTPTLYFLLFRLFSCWFQSESSSASAKDYSKKRISGGFFHLMNWSIFFLWAVQLPLLDTTCTHPFLCSRSVHIAWCNFLPMDLLAFCLHLGLQQFFMPISLTRPPWWSLLPLGSSTHVYQSYYSTQISGTFLSSFQSSLRNLSLSYLYRPPTPHTCIECPLHSRYSTRVRDSGMIEMQPSSQSFLTNER